MNWSFLPKISAYIPHGHCYLWQSGLVGLHFSSDLFIALAYYSIPITLIYFVRQRQDLPYPQVFWLFSAFIVACGTTHLLAVWTLWHPDYWLSAMVKAITAIISLYTAATLIPIVPQALSLPSPAQLELANEKLKESEAKFRSAFDYAAIGKALVSLEGKFIQVNPALCEILGYNETELLQKTFQELTHSDDLDLDLEFVRQMLAGKIRTYQMEKRYLDRAERWVWGLLSVSLVRDDTEKPLYFISQIQDISDRKQAETKLQQLNEELEARVERRTVELTKLTKSLQEEIHQRSQAERALQLSQERINSFIRSNLIGILFGDTAGGVDEANDEYLRIIGYSREELTAGLIRWDRITPPEYLERDRQGIAEARAKGSCTPYEKEYVRKDGSRISVLIGYILLGAAKTEAVAFILDITKRKQAEKLLQQTNDELEQRVRSRTAELASVNASLKAEIAERREKERQLSLAASELKTSNRALQDFAYVASHDLQEPLRKIRTFGGRLQVKYAEELGETGRDYLGRMQNAAERMQNLIRDLLSYSRITTKVRPFVATDLNQIAREVLSDLETAIEQSQAEITVGQLPTLEADPLQMRRLLQNLIGNALKFHQPDTTPTIEVAGVTASTSIELQVKDNGIGFDEKYLDRIFTPFQRLHGRWEYEGTGMGLAICRKIVERHGGTLTARSYLGRGTTFIITLPRTHLESDR